ncbi:helix-loop-helix protein delilah [Drosophila eugracilis]|uniref:helix-loop-helix protein delilah n=1 Tax=Drosophila eugracilis TaxID=29029 RepID=UPI0007E5FDEC|nr:helix-loop-helix protein delilah [Drosophila eugracilis]
MKSNTYELHNYADLNDMDDMADTKESRKRKTTSVRGEKYSLRQKRQKRNPTEEVEPANPPDFQLELDSLVEPVASKSRKNTPTKSKTKAPPLSKYRRKTANARERTRMREINTAFETLRHCVPQAITGEDAANTNEKLTKITTLRLAMKYITMLNDSIKDPSYESEFIEECLEESANREARVDFDVAEEAEVEVELPVPVVKKPTKAKGSGKKNSTASKRQNQKQAKSQVPQVPPISSGESCYATSSIGSPASSAYASLSSSYNSHSSSSSPGLEMDTLVGLHGISALDSLLLDASDGDSLSCLSPGYGSLLTGSGETLLPGCRGDLPMSGLEKPDVELSLRLLDQMSTDSFDFASDQQPSACISSLSTLDGYSFDLPLHSDFPDMFLT